MELSEADVRAIVGYVNGPDYVGPVRIYKDHVAIYAFPDGVEILWGAALTAADAVADAVSEKGTARGIKKVIRERRNS